MIFLPRWFQLSIDAGTSSYVFIQIDIVDYEKGGNLIETLFYGNSGSKFNKTEMILVKL